MYDPESAVLDYVGHPYSVNYSSGGGFSNVFGVPDYQKSALSTYFKDHDPDHPYYSALAPDAPNPVDLNITALAGNTGGVYNRIGRGIPDVSANGDNIAVFTGGEFDLSGGTSAATPIFASVVSLPRRIDRMLVSVANSGLRLTASTMSACSLARARSAS